MGMGKFITGVCERAGTVPVGLLCNGLAGVLMKLGETGSLSQALHQVGIGNGGTLSAVLIIAGLGGLGLANACKNRENAKKLADKIDAIDKTTDSHTVKLERIWEAVQASGVTLTAQDKLDLVAAVDAAVQKRLDRLPNPILQRLQEMGEAIQRDDAEIIEAIEAEARTLANQIAGVESRLAAILQSINAKFDQLLVTLQSQGIVLALEDRAPPLPLKYVERPVLMTALADALWGGGRASVTGRAAAQGDGGQGKSVLALAYAAEHADRYPGGCYRVVVENQSLESALARMIPALPALNQMPQADKARLARAVLSREPRCLLIIDNVDRLADWNAPSFDTLIPGGPCHVIVTSREEKLPRITPVPVGKLEPSEALAVLAAFRPSAADPRHKGAVASILRSVERLAVAVASVGALMVISEDDDWAAYAARLEAIPLDQYPEGHEAVVGHTGYSGRVFAALDDLFARLPAPAQRAMEYAALLPEDLIPAIDHLNGNPPEVKPADWLALLLAADADAAKGAARLELGTRPTGRAWEPHDFVRKLQTLGLLAPANPERTLWSLHRLHAKRIHERAAASNADRAALWAAIGACAVGREFVIVGENEPGRLEAINNPNVLTDSSIRWELTPLAEVCGALWQRGDAGAAAGIGLWLATTMLQLGRSADALNCLQPLSKHEAAVETTLGVAEFAKCYANLGTIQQGQGDLLGARASMERAIAIEQKHFSADHPTFATIYNNLAMLLRILGESDEALRYKQLSMAIERKYLGEDHPRMGASYSNLAQLQQDHGDLAGARASMERAITIQQKHFAPDHPTFGTRFSNLAMIQKDQGDLPGARASVERAIAISQKHLGPEHPNLATMRSNLALIQQAQGDLAGARASMERAVAIEQKNFASEHPTFATSYSNLATIQHAQGDLPGARASIEWAIAIAEKHLGPDHPNLATMRSNLAAIQKAQGDLPGARASMERAIAIEQKHYALDHPT